MRHPRTLTEHESAYPWDNRRRPFRAALLEWLGLMAESAAYEEPGDGLEGDEQDVIESASVVPVILFPLIYSSPCHLKRRDHAMFAARGWASATVDSYGPLVDSAWLVRCSAPPR